MSGLPSRYKMNLKVYQLKDGPVAALDLAIRDLRGPQLYSHYFIAI